TVRCLTPRSNERSSHYGLALGEGRGIAVGSGVGDGDGDGSGGHAPPSCFARVMTSVTPLRSISFDACPGAQTRAFWPTMLFVVRSMTSCPHGSAEHFVSTLSP